MSQQEVLLEFRPAINQPSFGRLSLHVNQAKIDTVKKLRERVAGKLNYFPECIFFFFKGINCVS
jgi:hypothetical protein